MLFRAVDIGKIGLLAEYLLNAQILVTTVYLVAVIAEARMYAADITLLGLVVSYPAAVWSSKSAVLSQVVIFGIL